MIVFRICKTKWAGDLSGDGAGLHGGRWNHPGTVCLYTSENRALAILEYTVNVNVADIPRSLSLITIEIPDKFAGFPVSSLPGDWMHSPSPSSTKDIGTKALMAGEHPVLRFPSIIVPQEFNFILNPLHPRKPEFKILEIADFVYDLRIKTV